VKPEPPRRDSATVGRRMSIADWHGLEDRVTDLETWAGPGQIHALAEGQQAIRADIAKLQITVDRHGKVLTRLTRQVSGLETKVANLDTRLGSLETKVANLDTRLASLETKVANLDTRLASLETKVANLDTRLGSLETKVANLDTRLGSLETKVANLDTRLASLETKVANLEADFGVLKQDMVEVKGMLVEVLRRLPSPN
jgi:chromosome segregation ATPase